MSNKAETVLVISKNNDCPNISEVHALHIREKEFKPFAFTVNEGGLPVLAEGHLFENVNSLSLDRQFSQYIYKVFLDGFVILDGLREGNVYHFIVVNAYHDIALSFHDGVDAVT